MHRNVKAAVVIPCYNEERLIRKTIERLPSFLDFIIAVNDGSTDDTLSELTRIADENDKVVIVDLEVNQGVGGAVIAGFESALSNTDADVIGIVAGDDQFDTSYLQTMLDELLDLPADYVKASRFFHREEFKTMPRYRRFGNIFISLLTKFSTGYYSITDITNGCGFLRRSALERVDFSIVQRRYDYETSMLTALSIAGAKVVDHAVPAHYGEETSTIRLIPTAYRNLKAIHTGFWRRIFYKYVLYGFHPIALFLLSGIAFVVAGGLFGLFLVVDRMSSHMPPTSGTVMLSVLPIILGLQMLLTALTMDVSNENS